MFEAKLTELVEACCPITGISFGDVADKLTWKVQFDAMATDSQKRAAQKVISDFDPVKWVENYKAVLAAQGALTNTDMVAMRCWKADVPFPTEWKKYCDELRAIIREDGGTLPKQPPYPKGT